MQHFIEAQTKFAQIIKMLFSKKQRYLLRRLLDRNTFLADDSKDENSESGGEIYVERLTDEGFYKNLISTLSNLDFNEPDLRKRRNWRRGSV